MRTAVLIIAAAVALLIVAVALGVLSVALPVGGRAWERPAVLAAGTGGHAFIVGGLWAVRARGHLRRVVLVGVAAALVAWLLWAGGLTGALPRGVTFAAVLVTGWTALLLVAGTALAQASSRTDARALRISTVALVALLALAWPWALVVVDTPQRSDDLPARAFGALALLALAGLAALAFLVRLRRTDPALVAGPAGSIGVVCPRCGAEQSIRYGGAACGRCGLRITVHRP